VILSKIIYAPIALIKWVLNCKIRHQERVMYKNINRTTVSDLNFMYQHGGIFFNVHDGKCISVGSEVEG
jgi:hypothetical protein